MFVMFFSLMPTAFMAEIAPDPTSIEGASVNAWVDKLNGNQNRLWIAVTDSSGVTKQDFLISNNGVSVYIISTEIGNYGVYVETKGNTQIRACYFSSFRGGDGR